ncbi:MAG: CAP domain-containing protein [Candidatus Pacebacteria bacterium]|jgi:hypothetical protein|nr:CAP domain-containing protein [Candidatus Paceibacterota bacterium]
MLKRIKNWFWPTKENNFHPGILSDRAISIFILLFLLVKVIFSFNLILVKQSSLFADVSAQEIFQLTNDIRKQSGLTPVLENSLLNQAARYKAEDMLQHSYFSHFSPAGISPWFWIEKAGYDYYYAGENLAMNFLDSEEVVKGWFNSPRHRDNLLNKNYQEMGIAVISGDFNKEGINRILVVQLFGAKKHQPSTPIALAQEPETTPEKETVIPSEQHIEESFEQTPSEVLSEQEQPTTEPTEIASSKPTIPIETTQEESLVQPEPEIPVATVLLEQQNILNKINNNTRNQVDIINKIIAVFIISFGLIILFGIVLQRQSIDIGISELVLRSFIVIILGISFFTFQLESIIGNLMIY